MQYYLFIDESGDHGLASIDPGFPVFVLCGVIFSEAGYLTFQDRVNQLKLEFWESTGVIFHSRDIRKCEKEFQILFDLDKKKTFYEKLNRIIAESEYQIIASAITKEKYIQQYGKLSNVYAISLSNVIEKTIVFLETKEKPVELMIMVEKRGKSEDEELLRHYNEVFSVGTGYVFPDRIRAYKTKLKFTAKKDNVPGLQLADLVAYPIARFIIEPDRVNLAFEILTSKLHPNSGFKYGLTIYP
jgi:hypothetical protein